MEIANVFTVECELGMEHDGFRIRETQIGERVGAELIGGSVYEIDPGKKLWPYHLDHANGGLTRSTWTGGASGDQ